MIVLTKQLPDNTLQLQHVHNWQIGLISLRDVVYMEIGAFSMLKDVEGWEAHLKLAGNNCYTRFYIRLKLTSQTP